MLFQHSVIVLLNPYLRKAAKTLGAIITPPIIEQDLNHHQFYTYPIYHRIGRYRSCFRLPHQFGKMETDFQELHTNGRFHL